MEKTCFRCGKAKPVDRFGAVKGNRDGRGSRCKPCLAELMRIRRVNDPEYVRRQLAAARARLAAGIRGPSQQLKPRKPRTAEQIEAARIRRLYGLRICAARKQADRFGAEINDFTLDDWYAVIDSCQSRCSYCGVVADLWIEHVVPLARGGDNTKSNVVPSCEPCNRKKARRTGEQFRNGLCEKGHPRSGANVYVYPNGKKTACTVCRLASKRRYEAKQKSKIGAA
jgi:hypothetical protein